MKPGKELNELVAFHVLEWRKVQGRWYPDDSETEIIVPDFSGDISKAWQVVDVICQMGFRLQLTGSKIWQARFYKSVSHTLETHAMDATSGNPATAICIAALAAKGYSESSR